MVFGKSIASSSATNCDEEEVEYQEEDTVGDEEVSRVQGTEDHNVHTTPTPNQSKGNFNDKPLYEEVTLIGSGTSKNAGGTKVWVCKHCKERFVSSYTRMHNHFFGPPIGKKSDIKRCRSVLKDPTNYRRLQDRVKEAEKLGVSKSLKTSIVTKQKTVISKKPIEESFSVMERSMVDLKIVFALSTNGIPFNVLRNPHFREMISAIKKAPEGYKAPSSEKARTTLLDECVRDVDKSLSAFKDTWYSQGLSIVSDGWTNIKHKPLINVLAVNSRGAMFIRIAENRDEERMLREQFASFHMKKGLYSLPGAQLDAVTMDAIDWWSTYGAETPELAEVARKVLSQPITSSSAERNWSTYSYIHSVKRNRLTCSRADKLVYVHSNARLCSRFSEAYKEGPHKKWDMNPESTNLENSMLEDMMWDDLDDDDDEDNGRGKRPRVD
ncbi:hypothetical protein LXL04_039783 [Taraxacum kok-saghyz]